MFSVFLKLVSAKVSPIRSLKLLGKNKGLYSPSFGLGFHLFSSILRLKIPSANVFPNTSPIPPKTSSLKKLKISSNAFVKAFITQLNKVGFVW